DQKTPQPEDGKAFFGRDAMANYMLVGCRQLGMEIFSVKGGQVTLQLDRAVLRKLWNAYYIPYINGYYTASGRFRSDDIKMGNIVAMVGSTTGVTYFPDCVNLSDSEGYPITCLMQAAPRFAQGKPVVVQQGAGMVVTKSDPQTERAATTFLKWFTQSQRNAEFAIAAGYLPVKRDVQHPQVLESIWKEWEGVHLDERTRLAYTTAMRQMEICSLYAGKAFSGGVEARDILEHALQDKAQEDRAQVEAHIAAGMPREEAVLSYCTDENFEAWYQSLHGMLQQVIHEGSFSK
ncbi:MAG: extracellular solute-binding protein, partial [Clostridia bacterium]